MRETVRIFKDHLTKISSDAYDPDLLQADTLFRNDATKFWFPSAESRFERGVERLRAYIASLRSGSPSTRPIVVRNVETHPSLSKRGPTFWGMLTPTFIKRKKRMAARCGGVRMTISIGHRDIAMSCTM